jgi:hypothetical protein
MIRDTNVCGIGCICENEVLREMIKSIHMVIKQAAQASVAYSLLYIIRMLARRRAESVALEPQKEMSVGHVGGMNVSWPCRVL